MISSEQISKFKSKLEERGKLTLLLISGFSFFVFLIVFLAGTKAENLKTDSLVEEIALDFHVFETKPFKSLKIFKGSSLLEEKGRTNPFVPVKPEELKEGEIEERGEI